jgi:hypothetical protein
MREMKNRNSRMREMQFHAYKTVREMQFHGTVLYGFYGFDLTNNAKKIHVRK